MLLPYSVVALLIQSYSITWYSIPFSGSTHPLEVSNGDSRSSDKYKSTWKSFKTHCKQLLAELCHERSLMRIYKSRLTASHSIHWFPWSTVTFDLLFLKCLLKLSEFSSHSVFNTLKPDWAQPEFLGWGFRMDIWAKSVGQHIGFF